MSNLALDFLSDWTQKQLDYEAQVIQKLTKYQYEDDTNTGETN